MDQKQRAARHAKRFAARFGQNSLLHGGQTLNLSDRGVALRAQEVYPAGTHLRIAVKPTDRAAFALEGNVIWAHAGNEQRLFGLMGVKLTAADSAYTTFVRSMSESGASRRPTPWDTQPNSFPGGPPSVLGRGSVPGPSLTPPTHPQSPPPRSWIPPSTSRGTIPPGTLSHPTTIPPAITPAGNVIPPTPRGLGTIPQRNSPLHATIPPVPMPTDSAPYGVIITPPPDFQVAVPASTPPPAPPTPVPSAGPLAAVSFDSFLAAGAPSQAHSLGGMTVVRRAPSSSAIPGVGGNKPMRLPRFDYQLPLRWGQKGLDREGTTLNLSRTGLSIAIDGDLATSARIQFAIMTGSGAIAKGTGVAMWQRKVGGSRLQVGFRILHADNRYFELLDSLARR